MSWLISVSHHVHTAVPACLTPPRTSFSFSVTRPRCDMSSQLALSDGRELASALRVVAYDGEESGPQLVSKITARLGCARTASLLQYFGVRSWPEVIKEATECGDEDALFLG